MAFKLDEFVPKILYLPVEINGEMLEVMTYRDKEVFKAGCRDMNIFKEDADLETAFKECLKKVCEEAMAYCSEFWLEKQYQALLPLTRQYLRPN